MSPIVTVVGGEPPEESVSISLAHTQIVLADLRRALPELERELRKKWPALVGVRIEHKVPMLRNPMDATTAMHYSAWAASAGLHLAAIFTTALTIGAGAALGKEAMTPPAKEVGKFLRNWVQKFTKKKRKHKALPKRTTKSRKRGHRSVGKHKKQK